MNALDRRFGAVVDAWDGAKIQLAATEKQLAANRAQLSVAQKQSLIAQRHAARLLVTIYEGESPDLIQLLVGSSKLSDVINAVQYTARGRSERGRTSLQPPSWRGTGSPPRRPACRRPNERNARRSRNSNEQRASIGAMIAKRRTLLSSIQSEIAVIQAREAEQQARAAAAARARLARQAALLREQAAERAKAARRRSGPAQGCTAGDDDPLRRRPPRHRLDDGARHDDHAQRPPTPPPVSGGHPQAASIALQYLGVPYQWGGGSPATGFDCSGLVMYVFAQLGVQLPHFAAGQYSYGSPVSRSQLQPGDLVFFDGLSHVGIYIGNNQIVHAPHSGDVVRIASMSEFAGRYVGARRV